MPSMRPAALVAPRRIELADFHIWSGEVPARAQEHKHREFQFWAEQSVSL